MKALIDTNVVLDVLLQRDPHFVASAGVWRLVEEKVLIGGVSAVTFNNAFYILRKPLGWEQAMRALKKVRVIFDVVDLTGPIIDAALSRSQSDFEDALQVATAVSSGVECIISRDRSGFLNSPVPVITPSRFLASLSA